MAATAVASLGKSAATQASSAARMAAPSAGPFATPRATKSADLSGNTGTIQWSGSDRRFFHALSAAPSRERAAPLLERGVRLDHDGRALRRLLADVEQADARVGDAEQLAHVRDADARELDEVRRSHLGVRADVEHKHGAGREREDAAERGALDALDAAEQQQREREDRAGVASGDERVRLALFHELDADVDRGVATSARLERGVVAHLDHVGGVDDAQRGLRATSIHRWLIWA